MFADIILPLALPKRTYTYSVPEELEPQLAPGLRVEVPFGNSKLYSGLVERMHNTPPDYRVKSINAVLDEIAVVTPELLKLWDWMADYYCCTLGEVMAAALPGHLKLSSETNLVFNPAFGDDFSSLSADEYLIAEALLLQNEITVDTARKILNKKTVFPTIHRLLGEGVLSLREDLKEKFKPRSVYAVRLSEPYLSDNEALRPVFQTLEKASERQLELLLALLGLAKKQPIVRRSELLKKAGASEASLKSLAKKGILEIYKREISRIGAYDGDTGEFQTLSTDQASALETIRSHFETKNVVLLHGVTGSGKTRLYTELMQEVIRDGGQVLYLLPEIALTTQIIGRLQQVFGSEVAVYHSKINYQERVEIWRAATSGKPVILSARSGLFLPFKNLKMIVVDEEHDPSFKQYDPAPRYHARDTAIYLANLCGAKVLLGSATPAIESYYNALQGKYGLVELKGRFSGVEMPEIQVVDLRKAAKSKQMSGMFSPTLLEGLKLGLEKGEQAILFQNRRGFAPILECQTCGWTAMCKHCDVSLTYHQYSKRLRCHYCGYQRETPAVCPACESGKITMLGFGTEKIEEELNLHLPEMRTARLDLDTAGSKTNLAALLHDFEDQQIDVLVGTQMVTKGLDFDNVGLVGVVGADQLLRFPDFRAGERAFQLLTQVAGRAGRKNKRGKVLIQAWNPDHPVLTNVINNDFQGFLKRELAERQEFQYPPFVRLIHLDIRHKDDKMADHAAQIFAGMLREKMGVRVMGPVIPHIPRVRSYYHRNIMLKLERTGTVLQAAKALIKTSTERLLGQKGFASVGIGVDVDPM